MRVEEEIKVEAGPKLDAEIAAKVFGWTDLQFLPRPNYFAGFLPNAREHNLTMQPVSRYSTEIVAAMEVVERFEDEGWRISLNSSPHAPRTLRWRVDLFKERFPREENVSVSELSETLPEAICLAALSAKAAEVNTR